MAFPCPLFMTSMHFGAQWAFSVAACDSFPSLGGDQIDQMTWWEWFFLSVPCGVVTSGDIGLSNLSMVSLSLSFYTMTKSSTPVFVLGWAYVLGIEKITWPLVSVILVIALGEFLTVKGEVDFKLGGFLLCLSAAMLSGARWTLVQLKIQKLKPPLKTTLSTMKLLSPSMFVSLLLCSLVIEEPWRKLGGSSFQYASNSIGLALLGATLAISMILCEFYLIMHANAIVLMIGGVVKELVTIFLGVTLFDERLNRINTLGCVIVFFGVVLYKLTISSKKARHEPVEQARFSDSVDNDGIERSLQDTEELLACRESSLELRRNIS